MVFEFRLSHPKHGDYYTGKISAEDRAEAKQQLLDRAQDRFELHSEMDDRVAVNPEKVAVHLKEAK